MAYLEDSLEVANTQSAFTLHCILIMHILLPHFLLSVVLMFILFLAL